MRLQKVSKIWEKKVKSWEGKIIWREKIEPGKEKERIKKGENCGENRLTINLEREILKRENWMEREDFQDRKLMK